VARTGLIPVRAAVAFALTLSIAACGSDDDSTTKTGASGDDGYTVGIVALDATQITANRERAAAQEAMKAKGWETIEVNSNGQPAAAITAMQNLVQRQVDAIVVQTYTADQLTAGLAAAEAAGIPVFSSSGGAAEGSMAGAVELVNAAAVNDPFIAALKDKPKVELLQLRYTPGAPCRVRADDLDSKLKDLPNVKVTRQEVTIPGGEQSAQTSTAGWLQAKGEDPGTTLAIWPCFSEAAIGAIAAEKQLKRGPHELYTWDISGPAIQAVQEGYMTAVLWIQVEEAGKQLAELVAENKDAGDGWEPKTVPAPSVLVTKDNIAEVLKENPDLGK
jgi:ribose transport system substrate-binding protein